MQIIIPILRYNDARTAIQWLVECFGFELLFSVPDAGPIVRHAQLRFENNIIMLGSVRESETLISPQSAGVSTQALYVYVSDVDAHHARSSQAGADIVSPPTDTDFGAREYHARDCEGHQWVFGNYLPDFTR